MTKSPTEPNLDPERVREAEEYFARPEKHFVVTLTNIQWTFKPLDYGRADISLPTELRFEVDFRSWQVAVKWAIGQAMGGPRLGWGLEACDEIVEFDGTAFRVLRTEENPFGWLEEISVQWGVDCLLDSRNGKLPFRRFTKIEGTMVFLESIWSDVAPADSIASDHTITLNKKVLSKSLSGIDLFYILHDAGEKGSELVTSAFKPLMTRMGMLK